MKNLFYVFLVVSLASCSKVKPKGEIATKDITVQDFNKLDINGKFKVFYVQNSKNMVSVETYPNVFDNLKIEVKDKTLYISEKSKTEGVDMYNITLYSKNNLESIAMADSTDITISSQMSVPAFKLKIKDNAKFMGSVLANKADITMTNKAKANLLGRTLDANIAISDTASIISPYWYINNLNITSKNGNYSEFSVDDELNGSIGNTSELVYYGNPQKKIKVQDKAKLEQKQKP
ncbi:DUF2807 domain-containing protein [Elizabethkingia anophelis]|uniref:DUF2807 domain-containing protein n=1 Tax=Elizabethkingia anophelis R26 TaxID=1246994 RepID=A0ABM6MQV2_9FLAO|nr:DUF2807 domain-containing protein [Elizabethkingia anophelis]ATC35494.1 DUF2807 domain-containing protein [Elizabethkingia anophelis R26]ATC39132.1 DUF2807 domain-containing protein [Elizabethkingia anophelis Ag1]ATC42813.1 DUF2807 domain-containing protein [Elizabethkingia anophelis]ATC46489.1 DUF2807 domain-containing protein [Elizabethkingia anophelis]ELR78687.1 hypothetical protein D505_12800 [Elizabethkingia anophelis R26]